MHAQFGMYSPPLPTNHPLRWRDKMDFEACLQRMRDEILPLVQQPTFPPRLPEDILEGSLDLILYRNLCYALEFCFGQLPVSVVSHSQLEELSLFARTQVIPAYLAFFNAHLLLPGEAADASAGEKCSLFFVRQENNSSWAKVREDLCLNHAWLSNTWI